MGGFYGQILRTDLRQILRMDFTDGLADGFPPNFRQFFCQNFRTNFGENDTPRHSITEAGYFVLGISGAMYFTNAMGRSVRF